jgi:hypothetical protein
LSAFFLLLAAGLECLAGLASEIIVSTGIMPIPNWDDINDVAPGFRVDVITTGFLAFWNPSIASCSLERDRTILEHPESPSPMYTRAGTRAECLELLATAKLASGRAALAAGIKRDFTMSSLASCEAVLGILAAVISESEECCFLLGMADNFLVAEVVPGPGGGSLFDWVWSRGFILLSGSRSSPFSVSASLIISSLSSYTSSSISSSSISSSSISSSSISSSPSDSLKSA